MQNKLPQGGSLGARVSGCTYLMAIGSNFHGMHHLIRIQDMNSKGGLSEVHDITERYILRHGRKIRDIF